MQIGKTNFNPNFGMKIKNDQGLQTLIEDWRAMGYKPKEIIGYLTNMQNLADDSYSVSFEPQGMEYVSNIRRNNKNNVIGITALIPPREVLSKIKNSISALSSQSAIDTYVSEDYYLAQQKKDAEAEYAQRIWSC